MTDELPGRRLDPLGMPTRPAPTAVTIVAQDVGPRGGMESCLRHLVIGLCELGHRVTVVARTCELPAHVGVAFHRVRGPARPVLLAYPWFLLAGSLVARWRHRGGVLQATGALVLNRVDVIAVHYCHQTGPSEPSRRSAVFRAHAALVGAIKRVAERRVFAANGTAIFVCVSDGLADELRAHYPQLAARVVTIPNGVDTARFKPGTHARRARSLRARLGIEQGPLLALLVGTGWERKGLEPVLRALAEAPAWQLLVVGHDDPRGGERLASALGLRDRVHLLGPTSEPEVLYAAADAFVLPSSYETFSLVAFEAAASGLPILATPVSGIVELLRDGVNGFVIDRDPATIALRLNRLADERLRRRLGEAARESVRLFTWRRMAQAHHELYERLARDV